MIDPWVHVYDSTDPAAIPATADFILAYMDGRYQTLVTLARTHPHSRIIQCTVTGRPGVRVCDVERGDLTPEQGAAWAIEERNAGRRGWVYASTSTIPLVVKALQARHYMPQICDWWEANYNGASTIAPGRQAHQYASANDPATSHLAPAGCDVSVALLSALMRAE